MARPCKKIEQVKICSSCNESKDLSAFRRNSNTFDGHESACASCRSAVARDRWVNDRSAGQLINLKQALKRAGGLTIDTFNLLVKMQNGRCAICGVDSPGSKRWHVDHDHNCCPVHVNNARSCGRCTRELLCSKCNTGLGLFNDSVDTLMAAIKYLQDAQPGLIAARLLDEQAAIEAIPVTITTQRGA